MNRRLFAISVFIGLALSLGWARDKNQSLITMFWPDQTNPTLKLTFEPFSQLATYNGQMSLASHVLVENLSHKRIAQASFTVYLEDKKQVRVGNGFLTVSDLEAGQQVRLSFQVMSVGLPTTLHLVTRTDAAGMPVSLKTVPLKIVSIPAGATLKVDGQDAGITPVTVALTIGEHTLSFGKEGYASGTTPVDIKPDEALGGSITLELGGLSQDNLELRNGKVLQGDVLSLSLSSVVIRIQGQDQTIDRNQVAKIILVQREGVEQPVTAPAQPE